MSWKRTIRSWVLAGLGAAMLLVPRGTAWAGPMDFAKLAPATHEVFIYVDVGQVIKSKMYQNVRSTIFDQNTSAGLAGIEQFTGVHLPDDIDIVAASGKIAQDNQGCLYVKGRWDRQRIEGLFKMNPGYAEVEKPGGKVIAFLDEKKGTTNYLAFLSDNQLVIGNSGAVETALGLFSGKAKGPSLAENPTLQAYLGQNLGNPVAMVVALKPQALPPNVANQPAVRSLKSVFAALLESPESLSLVAQAEADSPAMAAKWLDIAKGIIALGQVQGNVPKLAEIANGITAAQRGAVLEIKASMKTADAADLLKQRIVTGRSRAPMAGQRMRGGQGPGAGPAAPPSPAQW